MLRRPAAPENPSRVALYVEREQGLNFTPGVLNDRVSHKHKAHRCHPVVLSESLEWLLLAVDGACVRPRALTKTVRAGLENVSPRVF